MDTAQYTTYLMKKGDSLQSIASDHGILDVEDLRYYHNHNCEDPKDGVGPYAIPGQELLIPPQNYIETANTKHEKAQEEKAVLNKPKEQHQEAKKEEEKKKEEKEAAKGEHDGKYFVVHGATCGCDQSEDPSKTAKLQVTSQNKVILNGDDKKFAATEDDKTFDPPAVTFGKCKLQPSSSGNLPCSLAPAPKWEKPYDKKTILGKKSLTELSTLQCTIGGKITIKKHGQKNSVMKQHAENTNPAELALLSPAVKMPKEEAAYPSVSSITLKTITKREGFEAVDSKKEKAVEKIMLRPNEECAFSAKVTKGNVALTSWVIYDGHTGASDKKLLTHEQVGTEFKNAFPTVGKYRVEGYGKPKKPDFENGKYDKNDASCSLDFEVATNQLDGTTLAPMDGKDFTIATHNVNKLRQGFPATFSAKFLLEPTPLELERLKIYATDASGNTLSGLQIENVFTFTPNNSKAKYTIIAEYTNEEGIKNQQTFVGETQSLSVMEITHNAEVIRPGTAMSFSVAKTQFNFLVDNDSDLTATELGDIKWNLNGTLIGTGRTLNIPAAALMQKKKYVVEAYAKTSNGYGHNAKDESDDWHFEVKDNDVVSFAYVNVPKVGKKTQLVADRFVFKDTLPNEEIVWETALVHTIINPKTIEIKPTVAGKQLITCKINRQKGIKLSIDVKQAAISDVMFTDNNGIQIEKSSWGQKVNLWIDGKELQGEDLIVTVWDDDSILDDSAKTLLKKKYDGGLIALPLDADMKSKTGNWARLYVKIDPIGFTALNAGVDLPKNGRLDVQNVREIYAAHIGDQDGKERHHRADYDMKSWFYAKSRGIKPDEQLHLEVYGKVRGKDTLILEAKNVRADDSGVIKVELNWGLVQQKLPMQMAYAYIFDKEKNKMILATTTLIKSSEILKLADYKSAVIVGSAGVGSGSGNSGSCVCKDYDLIWGNKVSCDFRKRVVAVSKNLGLPQEKNEGANWLMAIMALETNYTFSPRIGSFNKNPDETARYKYIGLIQFGKAAATSVGTTRTHLMSLSAEKQLDYVEKYYQQSQFQNLLTNKTALYLAVNYPNATNKASQRNYVVYDSTKDAYDDNPIFKREQNEFWIDKDGKHYNEGIEGATHVWEFEETLNEIYNDGKKHRAKVLDCNKSSSQKDNNEKIVVFDSHLSEDRIKVISQFTIEILEKAAKNSLNDKLIITSTIRSTRKQAEIMYENESSGNHIRYAQAGREVIEVFNTGRKDDESKEKIISNMDSKIIELAKNDSRVSLHCVPLEVYNKNNIFDISFTNGVKNPRDLIRELVKDSAVTKIIHPLNNVITNSKISYDSQEQAIHVEIKIP